jgi:hypothetical protein
LNYTMCPGTSTCRDNSTFATDKLNCGSCGVGLQKVGTPAA